MGFMHTSFMPRATNALTCAYGSASECSISSIIKSSRLYGPIGLALYMNGSDSICVMALGNWGNATTRSRKCTVMTGTWNTAPMCSRRETRGPEVMDPFSSYPSFIPAFFIMTECTASIIATNSGCATSVKMKTL